MRGAGMRGFVHRGLPLARLNTGAQAICGSRRLRERGEGVRFSVELSGRLLPAFAVRYRGRVYAFINRCAHRGVELDWVEGRFFDADDGLLICATHGARYHPDSGECAGGPCAGGGLSVLAVEEEDDTVWLVAEDARLVTATAGALQT